MTTKKTKSPSRPKKSYSQDLLNLQQQIEAQATAILQEMSKLKEQVAWSADHASLLISTANLRCATVEARLADIEKSTGPVWKTADGTIIPMRQMTDSHLANSIAFLERQSDRKANYSGLDYDSWARKWLPKLNELRAEQERRKRWAETEKKCAEEGRQTTLADCTAKFLKVNDSLIQGERARRLASREAKSLSPGMAILREPVMDQFGRDLVRTLIGRGVTVDFTKINDSIVKDNKKMTEEVRLLKAENLRLRTDRDALGAQMIGLNTRVNQQAAHMVAARSRAFAEVVALLDKAIKERRLVLHSCERGSYERARIESRFQQLLGVRSHVKKLIGKAECPPALPPEVNDLLRTMLKISEHPLAHAGKNWIPESRAGRLHSDIKRLAQLLLR